MHITIVNRKESGPNLFGFFITINVYIEYIIKWDK